MVDDSKRNFLSRAIALLIAGFFSGGLVWFFVFSNAAEPVDRGGRTVRANAVGQSGEGKPREPVSTIALSDQARGNLGLQTSTLKLTSFTETVDLPATVTPLPGRTHIEVTSPMTGVIESIAIRRGEMIQPGAALFTLRMTHQALVEAQEAFLAQLGQLDIELKEVNRLESISRSGAVAGKTLIARQYELDKLQAGIRAARQAMLLDGLTEAQVQKIETDRELVRKITIRAPEVHDDLSLHDESAPRGVTSANHPDHMDVELLISELEVNRGQSVTVGQRLATLSDFGTLLLRGHAFERDVNLLRQASAANLPVRAVFPKMGPVGDSEAESSAIDDLRILRIDNQVDSETRLISFYVLVENSIEQSQSIQNRRYVSWRLKPGQRLMVQLPIKQLPDVFSVPKQAVAQSGPDRYVFLSQFGQFERVPVRILAESASEVALENKRPLREGRQIVIAGAHQLQMAMEQRSAVPVDPHAGHNH